MYKAWSFKGNTSVVMHAGSRHAEREQAVHVQLSPGYGEYEGDHLAECDQEGGLEVTQEAQPEPHRCFRQQDGG